MSSEKIARQRVLERDAEVGLEGVAPRFLRGKSRAPADFDAALDGLEVIGPELFSGLSFFPET